MKESTNRADKAVPRIAIPVPHSGDRDYAERALPQYEAAVRAAGGEPMRIDLERTPEDVMKFAQSCDAVLLPGSGADVDPRKYGAVRHSETADADAKREAVDGLLLREAYETGKPVLGICYGLQSLNVFRGGTLVQHIESAINHPAGRAVELAHTVTVEPQSLLAEIVGSSAAVPVNSSHHQSADLVGKGLRLVARSSQDGVVEALEGTMPEHFVLAVQWHPERSVNDGPEVAEPAKAIFRRFIEASAKRAAGDRETLSAK